MADTDDADGPLDPRIQVIYLFKYSATSINSNVITNYYIYTYILFIYFFITSIPLVVIKSYNRLFIIVKFIYGNS